MPTQEATEDQCIELAQALEQQRALHIVAAVMALPVGGATATMPTQFQAGYQLACEEIDHRLRTEQWEFCATPAPLPPNDQASGARSVPLDAPVGRGKD